MKAFKPPHSIVEGYETTSAGHLGQGDIPDAATHAASGPVSRGYAAIPGRIFEFSPLGISTAGDRSCRARFRDDGADARFRNFSRWSFIRRAGFRSRAAAQVA